MQPTLVVAKDSTPIPSKRPQTFYASPALLSEIKARMNTQTTATTNDKPIYLPVKQKRSNYEIQVRDTNSAEVLRQLRAMDIEQR